MKTLSRSNSQKMCLGQTNHYTSGDRNHYNCCQFWHYARLILTLFLFPDQPYAIAAAAQALLGELAGIAALAPAEEFEIIVVGHTDDTPISEPATLAKHPSNWHLSVHRAIAVKNTLVSAGLPEARMGVMGYGPCRPLGGDKARDRRVEVFFVRKGEVKPLPAIRVPTATTP